ncbi:SAM-dependent methyltransferase, partial [Bacillus mycoides]
QYIRGEARLNSHFYLVREHRKCYSDKRLKDILRWLNQCIIEGVSTALWLEVQNEVEVAIDGLFRDDV